MFPRHLVYPFHLPVQLLDGIRQDFGNAVQIFIEVLALVLVRFYIFGIELLANPFVDMDITIVASMMVAHLAYLVHANLVQEPDEQGE